MGCRVALRDVDLGPGALAGVDAAVPDLAVAGLLGRGQQRAVIHAAQREVPFAHAFAAQEACDREVWDRCINTSERTRTEIDIAQRYPLPHRAELQREARAASLDAAYVYALIRQESRFVLDARSHVGAAGLMQVMPATAKWTARKVGMDYNAGLMHDRDFNLRIGTQYLKLVLDRFDGAQALGAAAYNAGPNRPARWRDGPVLDAAVWAENIPFNETRDYVRKVLLGGAVYAQVLGLPATSLRERLGTSVGPAGARAADVGDVPPAATGESKS